MEAVGLVFPGQGTQVVGMGRSLVEHCGTGGAVMPSAGCGLDFLQS
jgi:malonyl CoA-acyl carrier protein transacylase